ncbi:MAG: hypothetical protein ACUVRM_07725 [Bacillota bacterium]
MRGGLLLRPPGRRSHRQDRFRGGRPSPPAGRLRGLSLHGSGRLPAGRYRQPCGRGPRRGRDGAAGIPATPGEIGPDGMVFREYAGSTGTTGFCTFRLEIPDYAKTGRYSALLYAAKEIIGRCSFNVEEFIPDRIKVETATDKDEYDPGEKARIRVRGINLFGPPAAGRRVELAVRLEPMPFSPAAYLSFTFGDPTLAFRAVEKNLGQGELDMEGEAEFDFTFPDDLRPPGTIRAIFQATVTEEGGRAVTSYKTVVFHPYKAYLGIKAISEEYAKPGEDYPLRLVEVDRGGKPVAGAELDVEIYAVTWNSIYRRDEEGRYTYQSERQEKRLAEDKIRLVDGEGTYNYRPPPGAVTNWSSPTARRVPAPYARSTPTAGVIPPGPWTIRTASSWISTRRATGSARKPSSRSRRPSPVGPW